MVFHASRYIKAGEEVTTFYARASDCFEKRQAELYRAYGITCHCDLCTVENGMDHPRIAALKERYDGMSGHISHCDTSIIPHLEKIIKEIKNEYAKRSQNQFLFLLIESLGGLSKLRMFQGHMQGHVDCLEEVIFTYSGVRDVKAYMKGENETVYYVTQSVLTLVENLVRGYTHLGERNKASKWEKMLRLFKDL